MTTDVLYVADLARKLGRTEAAIRAAVNRGGADWLPPRLNTRRLAWRTETVDKFLLELERPTPEQPKQKKKAAGMRAKKGGAS
jgi:hypothetical protein